MPNVERWHVGKLVILYVWGVGLSAICLNVLFRMDLEESPFWGLFLLAVPTVIALWLTRITWRWFSGRETNA